MWCASRQGIGCEPGSLSQRAVSQPTTTSPIIRRMCARWATSVKSTPNRKPKVWRLATWNTQYELITMCTSRASTSSRKTPCARPRARISSSSEVAGCDRVRSESSPADELAAVDVLDRHQPDEGLVVEVVVEGQLGEPAHRHDRVDVVDLQLLLGLADAAVGVLQHGQVELLLAAEVVVDHPLGGAGALGDLVDPGARVARLGEDLGGDGQQLGARALGIALQLRSRLGGHDRQLTGRPPDRTATLFPM